jgi:glucokinase
MILAGDIGAASARLALYDDRLRPVTAETYRTADYRGLGEIVGRFLADSGTDVASACFVVADGASVGPPWPVYAHELAEAFELSSVVIVDDLEANERGIEALAGHDLAFLNGGTALHGAARIAADRLGR